MSTVETLNAKAPKPDHVPNDAVVELDYLIFGGPEDAGFAAIGDHQLAWKQFQDSPGPALRWTPLNGGHWIATTAETVAQVLDNAELFSSKYILLPKEVGALYRFVPLSLDPPEHGPYRSILNPLLSHKVVRQKEAGIRQLAASLIDAFKDRGKCDFVGECARIVPVSVFYDFVGVPKQDRERLMELVRTGKRSADETARRQAEVRDYIVPMIAARRQQPTDDLLSGLLAGTVNGRPVTEEEALDMCSQLFAGGFHTTMGMMSFITLHMAQHQDMQAELRAAPERLQVRLDELFRRFSLVGIPRTATADTELAGQFIKEGDAVYVPLALYNFDDAAFDHPMEIDFNRRGPLHATFGRGVHKCPGSVLGLVEVRIVLEELLARVPQFRLDPDEDVVIKGGSVAGVEKLPLIWDI